MEQKNNEEITTVADKSNMLNMQPHDIWLQFNTITVGIGENKKTFDLVKIFEGLEMLGKLKSTLSK